MANLITDRVRAEIFKDLLEGLSSEIEGFDDEEIIAEVKWCISNPAKEHAGLWRAILQVEANRRGLSW